MGRKRINYIGQRKGVVEIIGLPPIQFNRSYVELKCDCGRSFKTTQSNFQKGKYTICTCYKPIGNTTRGYAHHCALPIGESSFNSVYTEYKSGAKSRGFIFNLTKDDVRKLTKQNCHYCNIEPCRIQRGKSIKEDVYVYNGIDRVYSSKGYELWNCVPCCTQCNKAKLTYSHDEFISWVRRIYKSLLTKGEYDHIENDPFNEHPENWDKPNLY